MSNKIDKEIVKQKNLKVCFTGHRPKGLMWGYDEKQESCVKFRNVMTKIIEKAILNGYTYFISGMALGVDMICAEVVLELKKRYKNVFLECAIPCLNQSEKWNRLQKIRYEKILQEADFIHYVSDKKYEKDCMNKRNEYMVKESDSVIAVWNGRPSGTLNTIKMARLFEKKIRLVDPNNPN